MDHTTEKPPVHSEDTQQEFMGELAAAIHSSLTEHYQRDDMGFFLCVSTVTEGEERANYISNAPRDQGIKWLRETANRLEASDVKEVDHG
jgi:hypothetical protein